MNILTVKPGVVMVPTHALRPEVALIPRVAIETAPETTDGKVWITRGADATADQVEGTAHVQPLAQAFDFRAWNLAPNTDAVPGTDAYSIALEAMGREWTRLMGERLGHLYDVLYRTKIVRLNAGGRVLTRWIHAELDPGRWRAWQP